MSGVRILVVDDSEIFTDLMARAIAADPRAELAGIARNGREGLAMAKKLKPDVISMDVYMPEMDGLDAVAHIMDEAPTPILMVTAASSEEMTHISFRAIGSGALDVLEKPAGPHEAQGIVNRLRLMGGVRVRQRPRGNAAVRPAVPAPAAPPADPALWRPDRALRPVPVVAIAISTGGPPVLERVLRELTPEWKASLVVVQHLSAGFGSHFVDWLAPSSGIPLELATTDARIRPGAAYLAPADAHLTVRMGGRLRVDGESERVDGHRPSGTVLLRSVAVAYGSQAAGIVLTGMGRDGAAGLLALRQAGGLTAAQDHASSAVDGMPKSARELGAAEHVVTLDDLPSFVRALGAPA